MKYLLITHTDLDGISPIILMKLTGVQFEYKTIEINEVTDTFKELFTKDLSVYEKIYITDLTIPESIYETLCTLNNVLVFDHHETHSYANKYNFTKIATKEFGHLTCGTELFYNYLVNIYDNLNTNLIKQYVEIVRECDTWDFIDKDFAKSFGSLPFIYGNKEFIKIYSKRLKKDKDKLEFTAFEKRYLKIEKERLERFLKFKQSKLVKYEINGYKVGVVFAEENKSELGNYLSVNNPDLDLIAIISACERVSYRTFKDDVECNKFASLVNGGGHKKASGSEITQEVRDHLIEYYFKNTKRLEEVK